LSNELFDEDFICDYDSKLNLKEAYLNISMGINIFIKTLRIIKNNEDIKCKDFKSKIYELMKFNYPNNLFDVVLLASDNVLNKDKVKSDKMQSCMSKNFKYPNDDSLYNQIKSTLINNTAVLSRITKERIDYNNHDTSNIEFFHFLTNSQNIIRKFEISGVLKDLLNQEVIINNNV